MTDRDRETIPAQDPEGVTPTTRQRLLWEALAGIQRIERSLERIESRQELDHHESQRNARRLTELEGRVQRLEEMAAQ